MQNQFKGEWWTTDEVIWCGFFSFGYLFIWTKINSLKKIAWNDKRRFIWIELAFKLRNLGSGLCYLFGPSANIEFGFELKHFFVLFIYFCLLFLNICMKKIISKQSSKNKTLAMNSTFFILFATLLSSFGGNKLLFNGN